MIYLSRLTLCVYEQFNGLFTNIIIHPIMTSSLNPHQWSELECYNRWRYQISVGWSKYICFPHAIHHIPGISSALPLSPIFPSSLSPALPQHRVSWTVRRLNLYLPIYFSSVCMYSVLCVSARSRGGVLPHICAGCGLWTVIWGGDDQLVPWRDSWGTSQHEHSTRYL